MDTQKEIASPKNSGTFELLESMLDSDMSAYLGQRKVDDILTAYKQAFGSLRVLAYEINLTEYTISIYRKANRRSRIKFADGLDGKQRKPSLLTRVTSMICAHFRDFTFTRRCRQ